MKDFEIEMHKNYRISNFASTDFGRKKLEIFHAQNISFLEPCTYLDSLVNYHLTSLPNQIFEAKKVAKKKLGFQVGKSHTQGFSLLTGMVFDIT